MEQEEAEERQEENALTAFKASKRSGSLMKDDADYLNIWSSDQTRKSTLRIELLFDT